MKPDHDETSEQTVLLNRQNYDILQKLLTFKRSEKIYTIQELIQSLMIDLQKQTVHCPSCQKPLDIHQVLSEISQLLNKIELTEASINPAGIHLEQSSGY